MNYLMLVCSDGTETPETAAAMAEGMGPWLSATEASGARKYGHELMEPETAKTVRTRGGETLVSDGPFAESKEFVAGFDLIEADDLDAAIEIAAAHPVAQFHSIELRPIRDSCFGTSPEEYPLLEESRVLPAAEHLERPTPGSERYLLLFCVDGIPASDEEEHQIMLDMYDWVERLHQRKPFLFGVPLQHPDNATTVRVRDGETLLSDGPFIEAKEFIAGFQMVDCESEQEAIELAAAHPLTSYHRTEVRAFSPDTP